MKVPAYERCGVLGPGKLREAPAMGAFLVNKRPSVTEGRGYQQAKFLRCIKRGYTPSAHGSNLMENALGSNYGHAV